MPASGADRQRHAQYGIWPGDDCGRHYIYRVANRTGIAPGKTVREVEEKLMKFVPLEFRLDAHHWLILHGRYVCKARRPACPACIIADLCEYRHKTPA